MSDDTCRTDLVELVRKIRSGEGTEDQVVAWVVAFSRSVPHPEASDLIYWPTRHGLDLNPTDEEIVDAALGYKPIQL